MLQTLLRHKLFFPLLFALGITLRVFFLTLPPQSNDMSTYASWGDSVRTYGLSQTYSSLWSDYLPLPMLLFGGISTLSHLTGLPYSLLSRGLFSGFELILILSLLKFLGKSPRYLAPLLLLFPPFLYNTAFWGQIDSFPALLSLLALVIILKDSSARSGWLSGLLYALAVATKPIMLIISPVFLVVALKTRRFYALLLSGILLGFGPSFFAVKDPLSVIRFTLDKAFFQAGMYPYTTVNAWNFWSLSGIGWGPLDSSSVFGISANIFGLILFLGTVGILFYRWYRTHWSLSQALPTAAILLLTFFTFTTRMHERHLLFGLPFLLVSCTLEPWFFGPLFVLTTLHTLNLDAVYYWLSHQQTWPLGQFWIAVSSWFVTLSVTCLILGRRVLTYFSHWLHNHRLLALILLLATVLRLANLSYPQNLIFDEVYHGFTAQEYMKNNVAAWEWWTTPPPGVAYEWTHPPVAKYGMVIGMLLFGENSFGWRFGSAIMGVLSILGLYNLLVHLTQKPKLGLLAAFLVSIEGLHLVQSRIAMNDTYMLAFLVWALYSAVSGRWKQAAIFFGLSLGSKWSALYGIVPLGFIYLHDQLWPQITDLSAWPKHLFHIFRSLLIVVIIYLTTFIPFFIAGHSKAQFIELHRQMWYYHTHLVATHSYQSEPWQWIFSLRPVWYYVNYQTKAVGNIYAQSNPLILWGGLLAFLLTIFVPPYSYSSLLFILLYLIFTLPWVFSPRIMFFYHYLPSAFFLCGLLAQKLSILTKRVLVLFLVLFCLSFAALSPVYYGYLTPQSYWTTLFSLFPSWR